MGYKIYIGYSDFNINREVETTFYVFLFDNIVKCMNDF